MGHWHGISMTDQTQGHSEECNLSLLVSAKGTRYFGAEKVKQDKCERECFPE